MERRWRRFTRFPQIAVEILKPTFHSSYCQLCGSAADHFHLRGSLESASSAFYFYFSFFDERSFTGSPSAFSLISRKFRTAPVVLYVAMPRGLQGSISKRTSIFFPSYSTSARVWSQPRHLPPCASKIQALSHFDGLSRQCRGGGGLIQIRDLVKPSGRIRAPAPAAPPLCRRGPREIS